MTKSSGSRTEPWGTPQEEVCQEVCEYNLRGTEMENVSGEQTYASATSDFVADFLSGMQVKSMSTCDRSALRPKSATRQRNR